MTLRLGHKLIFALSCLLAAYLFARAAERPTFETVVGSAIDKHVLPRLDALKDAAAGLPDAVGNVCKTGSPAAKDALRGRFRDTVEAYAAVDFLRFGPMLEGGSRERLSFWPDPRGFLNRQLRLVLLSKDPSVLEPGAIAKQSVAVQGLSALEVLLTDETTPLAPGDAAQYRCGFAHAIAVNIATVSNEIANVWRKPGGWKDKMLHPGPENDTYKTSAEAAAELVKALLVGLSLTADLQLKPQIDPKTKLAPPYAKAGLQKDFYAASVASLKGFYDALGLEAFLKPDKDWVKNWVAGAWRAILSSDGVGGLAPNAKRDDAPPVREVFDKMNGLRKLVIGEMAVDAGLTVGFNELDGD